MGFGFFKKISDKYKNKSAGDKFYIKLAVLIPSAFLLIVLIYSAVYFSEDHSIYVNLSKANYNNKNLDIAFKYPSIMKYNPGLVKALSKDNAPLVYSARISKTQNVSMAFSYLEINSLLSFLNLNPQQLMSQIQNNNGTYINFLNQKNKSLYSDLYGDCANKITNQNKQIGLLCVSSSKSITTAKIIGFDDTYQYSLTIVVPSSVWNQDQDVWQKIEKSFIYS